MNNTQTQNTSGADDTVLTTPTMPTAAELFDGIMSGIDERFTLERQKQTGEQLKQASPEEKKRIIGDFQRAMAEYNEQTGEYFTLIQKEISAYRTFVESAAHDHEEEQAEANLDRGITA
ncbi:MAG: hypothetical protein WC840_00300 [Candidatus Peribacteraceae bacterium]